MRVHPEVADALAGGPPGGRAREHDHRPRAAAARQPAGRARDRGRGARARRRAGDDRDPRRRGADRARRRRAARRWRTPTTSPSAACATSRRSSRAAAHGATTVAATAASGRARRASACSRPAGSAACTAARARRFDESADLGDARARRICVVCAGVKSILDIPATLERLETLNVTVLGYRHRHVPGLLPHRLRAPGAVAGRHAGGGRRRCCARGAALGAPGAVVVANPLPGRAARPGAARPRAARRARGRGRARASRGTRRDAVPARALPLARPAARACAANVRLVLRNAALAARDRGAPA